jgi:secreted trypsin-like serine protease
MKLILCLSVIFFTTISVESEIYRSPLESPQFKSFWENVPALEFANKFNRTGRITGGQIADRHQFPYQVGMLTKAANGNTYLCGGSLITLNYVLTAAHCLEGIESAQIFLGAHELQKDAYWKSTLSKSNFIIHENYNSNYVYNDIALVRLFGVSAIPGKIETVKLLPRALEKERFIGSTVRVSGWGVYADGAGPSPLLRFVDLTVRDLSVCEKIFGPNMIKDSNVCTTGLNNKSPCGGDSGGPLMTVSNSYQIGVVSFGAAVGCELGYPGVFTRVGSYLDWIAKNSDLKI